MKTTTTSVAELEKAERDLTKALERAEKANDAYTRASAKAPSWDRENLPHFAQRAAAHERVLEARGRVQHLRRVALRDRLAELDVSSAEARIRSALEKLLSACDAYRATVDAASALCAATKPLDGRAIESDERVHEWRRLALSVLESDFARFGLSVWAEAELNEALERDENG